MSDPVVPQPVLQLDAVWRSYRIGQDSVHALAGIDLEVQALESVAIVGASGSGKSTLLNVLGLLDSPTQGRHLFGGREVTSLSDDERADLRNQVLGFVFQQCHLVPHLDCTQNVSMPLLYRGISRAHAAAAAEQALASVGLSERRRHRPAELSGGQRQRVALARALVGKPRILLADEPTGSLDSVTGEQMLRLMLELTVQAGATLIMVTHDPHIAMALQRQIVMKDGRVIERHGPGPQEARR